MLRRESVLVLPAAVDDSCLLIFISFVCLCVRSIVRAACLLLELFFQLSAPELASISRSSFKKYSKLLYTFIHTVWKLGKGNGLA